MRQVACTYLKWLLPVVFITYYSCVSLFIHVHIERGTTIVHSHPFGKQDGGASHRHASWTEVQLFHVLSTLSVEDGAVHELSLHLCVQQIAEIIGQPVYPDYVQPDKGLLFLRAPPVI